MLILLAVLTDMTGDTSAPQASAPVRSESCGGKRLAAVLRSTQTSPFGARAADFAKWSARGIQGWSFEEVLTSYKAVENSPDCDDRYRGRSGLLPIRTRRPDELTPSLNAFIDAAVNQGFARIADFNGAEQAGVGPYPLNAISSKERKFRRRGRLLRYQCCGA